MNDENFNKWLTALRSGEYRQGDSRLFQHANSIMLETRLIEPGPYYCCLGVGCEVASKFKVVERWQDLSLAPIWFIQWLGLPLMEFASGSGVWVKSGADTLGSTTWDIAVLESEGRISSASASGLNDGGAPFTEIANWLEANRGTLVGIRA